MLGIGGRGHQPGHPGQAARHHVGPEARHQIRHRAQAALAQGRAGRRTLEGLEPGQGVVVEVVGLLMGRSVGLNF